MTIYLIETRKTKIIKKQEKDFKTKYPHDVVDWVFSLEKYVKNHDVNSIYMTENQWKELIAMDKERVNLSDGYTYTYIECGVPTFADCELAIIKKQYTYKEYLNLEKENE